MIKATEKPPLRSLPFAAERLGVTVACMRGWVYRRVVPYVKVGRSVRISDDVIEKIIQRGTIPARENE